MSMFEKFGFGKKKKNESNNVISLEEIRAKAEAGEKIRLEKEEEESLKEEAWETAREEIFQAMPVWKELNNQDSKYYLRLISEIGDDYDIETFIDKIKDYAKKEIEDLGWASETKVSEKILSDILNGTIYGKVVQFSLLGRMAGAELEESYNENLGKNPKSEFDANKALGKK